MIAWLAACCLPAGGEPSSAPEPFLSRPLPVDTDMGPPFDHGSDRADRALMHTGRLVPGKRGHRAHDWPVPPGTDVLAAADGTVLFAGDQGPARCDGWRSERNVWVRLLHDVGGQEYVTVYYHLSAVSVSAGQRVTAGQKLGESGNTGCSASPHLHFAVIRVTDPIGKEGAPVDPYGWSGESADPLALRGKPSAWLWREGQAPPLVRRHELQQRDPAPVSPVRIQGTDALAPIDGEWVEIGVRRDVAPQPLAGLALRNLRGDTFPLPAITLPPGGRLRIHTRGGVVSWGLDHEAWDDAGDCVMLVDPSGTVVAAMGTGSPECRGKLGTAP